MPIKPENRHRYPKDWKAIRTQILARAALSCEVCGVLQHGKLPSGKRCVLTIAHLDHMPEHNHPANLKAMCQPCHLAYDLEHHKKNARATRKKKDPQLDMFPEVK